MTQPTSPGEFIHHDDPGLQPERTSLSWTRTVLSLTVASLTMLRWSWAYPSMIYVQVVVMILLAFAVTTTQGRRYAAQDLGLARGVVKPNPGGVLLVSASLVLFAASELVLIIISAPGEYSLVN